MQFYSVVNNVNNSNKNIRTIPSDSFKNNNM